MNRMKCNFKDLIACELFVPFYFCKYTVNECVFQVWLAHRDVNRENLSQHRIQIGLTA